MWDADQFSLRLTDKNDSMGILEWSTKKRLYNEPEERSFPDVQALLPLSE